MTSVVGDVPDAPFLFAETDSREGEPLPYGFVPMCIHICRGGVSPPVLSHKTKNGEA